ncbi:PDF receptor-like [Amphiura filiformis]|uniref:PDF receptor-like n=1 Tax=Amphiura filiformis TaxID=82378 RepID=UPI003B21A392
MGNDGDGNCPGVGEVGYYEPGGLCAIFKRVRNLDIIFRHRFERTQAGRDCDECPGDGGIYCPYAWDGTKCWPPTLANTTTHLPCPDMPFILPSSNWSFCDVNGTWAAVADYPNCIPHNIKQEAGNWNASTSQLQFYLNVVHGAKIMEIVGYTLSWTSLLLALIIFNSFRSLSCTRTKIHKHFFAAFLIRLTFDITFFGDRLYSKPQNEVTGEYSDKTITLTPILCEVFEFFREYARLCMFAWMFIEGLYLNSLVSTAVFLKPKFLIYYIIGWVSPFPFVGGWGIAMIITNSQRCWYLHITSIYYYVLIEVPRNSLIVLNVFFMINIVRVLIMKLKESNSSEANQLKKALRAAIVLIPLLGITNLIWLMPVPPPTSKKINIILYNVVLLFLDSFQGFFVATVYCFLNQEVRLAITRKWASWRNYQDPIWRRPSMITTTSEVMSSGKWVHNRIQNGGETVKMSPIDEMSTTNMSMTTA